MRKLLGASCLAIILVGSYCLDQTFEEMRWGKVVADSQQIAAELAVQRYGMSETNSSQPFACMVNGGVAFFEGNKFVTNTTTTTIDQALCVCQTK